MTELHCILGVASGPRLENFMEIRLRGFGLPLSLIAGVGLWTAAAPAMAGVPVGLEMRLGPAEGAPGGGDASSDDADAAAAGAAGTSTATGAPADAATPAPASEPAPGSASTATETTAPMDSSSTADSTVSEPPAEAAPAEPEGPEDENAGYASSKDAGTAISGGEVDDRKTDESTVGDVEKEKKVKDLTHDKVGILGVGFSYGVSLITVGDKFCGEFSSSRQDPDSRKPVCIGATPPAIDILAGFGANKRIDVIVGVRVNLKPREFNTKNCADGEEVCAEGKGLFNNKIGIGVMPGIRIYGKDTDRIVKFGGQVQVMYMYEDFQGYRDRPNGPMEDSDPDNVADEDGVGDHFVGLRGGPLLQIDPHHNFGITLQPAIIPGFRPKAKPEVDAGWFEIGFEATLGLEARFP